MAQHGRGVSPHGGRTGTVLAQVIGEGETELRRPEAPVAATTAAIHGPLWLCPLSAGECWEPFLKPYYPAAF